jgi:hypothetical protein
MNKRFVGTSSILAMVALFVPMLLWSGQSGLQSKTFTGEVMDSICAPSGSHAATMAKTPGMGNDNETCTKKCVAMGAKYVLYDPTSHAVYSVEDHGKLAQFAGHKVRVTGTLNGSVIEVSNVNELG